ncbi:irregular chiasm C-roughest protein-like isoform X2 [Contarinia nasturtii]|uniref:irregular chiasm C-roughest protein-like isoform X2 n=1 Tax=Contarinia nasturtii TaxID=265458 RepID=UPI0012D41E66|nr:irregular chiasm C-roughest protein-like isoform X2 [Contarinia nasturtii]
MAYIVWKMLHQPRMNWGISRRFIVYVHCWYVPVLLLLLIQSVSIVDGHPKLANEGINDKHGQRFSMEPQKFAMQPQDQTAIVGSRVTLPCRVINKQGTLQWTKDDFGLGWHRNLSGFERYTMIGSDEEGDFSLDIYPVMLDDDAKYQCQVGPGPQGQPGIRSRFAALSILVPPEPPRILQGDFLVTTEDREIELECVSVGGKPAAEITWIDGLGNVLTTGIDYMKEPLSDSRRVTAKSILKLTPKKEHHNTTFTCQAQNTADRSYRAAKLKLEVKYAPKVSISVIGESTLTGSRIPEGSDVRFLCRADANPPNVTYRWYINEELVAGDYTTEMVIPNITRKYHDGMVKCEVHNAVGKSEESEALDISYGPVFKSRPKSIEADHGATISLTCDVIGNPLPDILWIHEPNDKVVGASSNLTIIVSTETAGKYFCKASVVGFPEISATASVYLKGPPTITSARRQYGITGVNTRIECTAFSVPKARHVSWTFMGHEISTNNNPDYSIIEEPLPEGIKSILIIRESQSKHFGSYNCTVVNEHGNDILEIELLRQETSPVLSIIVASVSFVIIILILVVFILFCRRTKKRLKPADVIPTEFKGCERTSNLINETKIDIRNDYAHTTVDGNNLMTHIPDTSTYNTTGSVIGPLGGVASQYRYSGDFTDTGQSKTGQNNNGYVANAADYSPPSQSTLLLRNGSSNTSSDTTYYPNGQVPSVNSTLTRNSRSTTVDSRQDIGLPNVHGSFNSLQNSILSQQPLLQNGLNVDLRYRATYANPFLRTSNASLPPLPPPSTANPSATPAPPPYNATRNTATTSGIVSTSTTSIKAPLPTSSSPSGQFILPANGHLKKGALATHV